MSMLMKHYCIKVCLLILMIAQQSIHAESETIESSQALPEAVRKAIELTPPVARNSWAYTRTETQKGTLWVEKFDPSLDSPWELISVNGEDPTEEQRLKREKVFAKRMANSDEYIGENNFIGLAKPDSWKQIDSKEGLEAYQFQPMPDGADEIKFMKFILGTLYINNDTGAVDGFELKNTRPFKPAAVAKINKFHMQLQMQKIAEDVYLPSKITTEVNGRAFFKKFTEESIIEFSSFKKVK